MDKSISWIYSRLDGKYAPKGREKKTVPDRKEILLAKLEKIKEDRKKDKGRTVELDEEVNFPLNRSYEELIKYREKCDKEQEEKLCALNTLPED